PGPRPAAPVAPVPVPSPVAAVSAPEGVPTPLPVPEGGVVLGTGRIARVNPAEGTVAVTTSDARVVEVVSSARTLLLLAHKAGAATVTVERRSGEPVPWEVVVAPGDRTPEAGPSGPSLGPPGDVLRLPVGGAAVCTIPEATELVRVEDPAVQWVDLGDGRWFVQVDGPTHGEAAFPLKKGPPRALQVASTPGEPEVPAACATPTETVQVAVGGTVALELGAGVTAAIVGHSSIAGAERAEDGAVVVTGVRPGRTPLAVRTTAGVTLRTVEVAAGP
ncbi:MAG: pilus assembly protein N-terminal domain-containing protein, partial [Myxococcota bacterium]